MPEVDPDVRVLRGALGDLLQDRRRLGPAGAGDQDVAEVVERVDEVRAERDGVALAGLGRFELPEAKLDGTEVGPGFRVVRRRAAMASAKLSRATSSWSAW